VGNKAVTDLMARSPVHDVIARPGRPLDAALRRDMEDALGHDFSSVRIHSDSQAAASARSVDAAAYTAGENIVLGSGTSLSGPGGRQLLAHELAHVVQQRRGPVDGTPAPGGIKISDPSDRFEQEADQVSRQIASNSTGPTSQPAGFQASAPGGAPSVQRLAAGAHGVVPVQRLGGKKGSSGAQRRPGRGTQLEKIADTLNLMTGQSLGSGHFIGGVGASSFADLRDAVVSYNKAMKQGASDVLADAKLARIEELAIEWFNTHRDTGDRKERKRRGAVSELLDRLAEERRAVTQEAAVDRYGADMAAGVTVGQSGQAYTYAQTDTPFLATGARADAAALRDRDAFLDQKIHFASLLGVSEGAALEFAATQELERLGVTPAEQAAIKTYTGNDYNLINPATQGSRSWMKAKVADPKLDKLHKPKDGTFEDTEAEGYVLPGTNKKVTTKHATSGEEKWVSSLMSEGALHAALATRGLAKMPPYTRPTYRGEGLAEAPKKDETLTLANMYSTTKTLSVAEGFMKKTTTADRPIAVLWVYTGGGGSDVSALSAIQGEGEVLVPAGAKYKVLEVREVSYASAPMGGDAAAAFKGVQDMVWAGSLNNASKVVVVRAEYIGGGVHAPSPTATGPDTSGDKDTANYLHFAALATARKLTREAKKEEPKITGDLRRLAKSRGGRLVGLEYRLKTEASLARKLEDRARTRVSSTVDPAQAVQSEAAKVNDTLRYTIIMPSGKYSDLVKDIRNEMQQLGYKAGNFWDAWATSDTYKGHNLTFILERENDTPLLFEVQVHTKDSFATKQEIHGMYEEARAADTSPARKKELDAAMAERWTKVKTPKGQFNKSALGK
jgi:hypothetical protein